MWGADKREKSSRNKQTRNYISGLDQLSRTRGGFDYLIHEQVRLPARSVRFAVKARRRKLRNPIKAVKSEIDGETTEFRGGGSESIRTRSVADRSSGRNLSNCTLGTAAALRSTYQSERVRAITAFRASARAVCPNLDKSICGGSRRRIALFRICDRRSDTIRQCSISSRCATVSNLLVYPCYSIDYLASLIIHVVSSL